VNPIKPKNNLKNQTRIFLFYFSILYVLLSSFTGKITEWIQLLCEIVHTNLKINIYLSVDFYLV